MLVWFQRVLPGNKYNTPPQFNAKLHSLLNNPPESRRRHARTAIPTNHVILEYTGARITKAESDRREARVRPPGPRHLHLHLPSQPAPRPRRPARGNISRFLNHSCQPNCRSERRRGRIWIIATHDIFPGQELTFDYGFAFRDWADNPCRCGAPNCAGYIATENQRWRLRRRGPSIR